MINLTMKPEYKIVLSELNINSRTVRLLQEAGHRYVGEICVLSEKQLLAIRGIGKVTLLELKLALADKGFTVFTPKKEVYFGVR